MTTTTEDLFCDCGYRESVHDAETKKCPGADGYKNIDGKTVFARDSNPGHTFSPNPKGGFN